MQATITKQMPYIYSIKNTRISYRTNRSPDTTKNYGWLGLKSFPYSNSLILIYVSMMYHFTCKDHCFNTEAGSILLIPMSTHSTHYRQHWQDATMMSHWWRQSAWRPTRPPCSSYLPCGSSIIRVRGWLTACIFMDTARHIIQPLASRTKLIL